MTIDISNRKIRHILRQLLEAGLEAGNPERAVKRAVKVKGNSLWVGKRRFDIPAYKNLATVGAGKASARMALALERLLGDKLDRGVVVTKDGHACRTRTITIREASHPVPDRRGQRGAGEILDLVRSLGPQDLLFVLISGGASSLLPAPAKGLSLADKQKVTDHLLRCGAGIQEINAVRKHLSAIKGGQLAASTQATIISLILSDVLGDDLATIGSGPVTPDPTTYGQAKQILTTYDIWDQVPREVRNYISKGLSGTIAETPKPGSRHLKRVHPTIIGNNAMAVAAISRTAKTLGLRPLVLTTTLTGEAREIAKTLGAIGREIHSSDRPVRRPACIIMGGEPTVRVTGTGQGGRAQELALSAANEIAGLPNIWVAAFGTDGTDGPTEAAGAVVDGQTAGRARRIGVDPYGALSHNDSYNFFREVGGHIITGATGTNINDICLLLAP